MNTTENSAAAPLHLLIKPGESGLYFAAYNPLEDDSYQGWQVEYPAHEADRNEAVKNAIYENPQLLQEYARTCIVVDSPHFAFVPEEVEPEEKNRPAYYDFCFPGHTNYVVENRLQLNRAHLLFGIDHDLYAFFCRTFAAPQIWHTLTPLCEYFALNSRSGSEAKIYLHLQEKRLCLIVFKQGRLLLANTFDIATPDDAAFYTLQAYKQLSLDQVRDRIYLTGSKAMRPALAAILQEYVRSVLPYPFPSQLFRLGKDTMEAPFELTTIPLCGL